MTTHDAGSGRFFLRAARLADSGPLAALYSADREYLAPFEPSRDEDFFTTEGRARLSALLAEREQKRAYPYLIEVEGRSAGRVTVTNVVLGPFCSGSLGYWVATDRTRRGVATRAVEHVLADCLTMHGLHRVEAATLVDNCASQSVLRRTGFTLIGRAPGYCGSPGSGATMCSSSDSPTILFSRRRTRSRFRRPGHARPVR